jgi:hypothetical protein
LKTTSFFGEPKVELKSPLNYPNDPKLADANEVGKGDEKILELESVLSGTKNRFLSMDLSYRKGLVVELLSKELVEAPNRDGGAYLFGTIELEPNA